MGNEEKIQNKTCVYSDYEYSKCNRNGAVAFIGHYQQMHGKYFCFMTEPKPNNRKTITHMQFILVFFFFVCVAPAAGTNNDIRRLCT